MYKNLTQFMDLWLSLSSCYRQSLMCVIFLNTLAAPLEAAALFQSNVFGDYGSQSKFQIFI